MFQSIYDNVMNSSTASNIDKNLMSLGPHIWNSLPNEIKKETEYEKIKNYMNDWFGLKCKCNICS